MLTGSIRGRFLGWLALLLLVVLGGFGFTAFHLHRTNQFTRIDRELERRLLALDSTTRGNRGFPGDHHGRPRPPGGGERPPPPPMEPEFRGNPGGPALQLGPREIRLSPALLELLEEDGTFYVAVWSRSGNRSVYPESTPADLARPDADGGGPETRTRQTGDRHEVYRFNPIGECFLVGKSIRPELTAIAQFGWALGLGGLAVLALGLGGGWWLVGNALEPMVAITATARRISAGNLAERIEVSDPENELGRLATLLNSTFSRLEGAFAQLNQFTADAAHELRTPLAVLISETQTALARERSAADYRETVEQCLLVAQQMRRLTESLLDLARLDAGQRMACAPLDLAELVRDSASLLAPLAAERQIRLAFDLEPASVHGDRDRLSQVIVNLLGNALAYNRPGGEVHLATRSAQETATLIVTDAGPGIAAEDLPHIFKRFYRADKARDRADGHSGLGLAICRSIVEAHGGTIQVTSTSAAGTTFTLHLPQALRP